MEEGGIQEFTFAALEAGLNLEVVKDESTKDTAYAWLTVGSLRKGMGVIVAVVIAIVLLILASGHWYFGSQRSVEMLRRVQAASEEHEFQEDVAAIHQAVKFAHFAELASGMHAQVSFITC
jgi:uncharacterized protein HemX